MKSVQNSRLNLDRKERWKTAKSNCSSRNRAWPPAFACSCWTRTGSRRPERSARRCPAPKWRTRRHGWTATRPSGWRTVSGGLAGVLVVDSTRSQAAGRHSCAAPISGRSGWPAVRPKGRSEQSGRPSVGLRRSRSSRSALWSWKMVWKMVWRWLEGWSERWLEWWLERFERVWNC